jgi:uncharacterized protein with FMN-binding domain
MSTDHVRNARRNATVLAATGVTVGGLFLFPTSTNHTGHRAGQHAAAAGVVSAPAPPVARGVPTTPTVVVNGTAADTPYGPVQVQLRVQGRRILRARAIVYPQASGRDREINSYAIPALDREVVQAQSASIDTVSGATYTSDGYRHSLQAALDAAHLG